MQDGSDAIADWPLLNALVNTAAGATWVSIHHGGGTGIGYSQHAGMVVVADGTDLAARKLERVLTTDPGMGVVRHVDAGYGGPSMSPGSVASTSPCWTRDPLAGLPDVVVLTGAGLTITDVERVARGDAQVILDPEARQRVQDARDVIVRLVESGQVVYGVTTGFGALASTYRRPPSTHGAPAAAAPEPRGGCRRAVPARGRARDAAAAGQCPGARPLGVRPRLIERLLRFLRRGLHPVVPGQGSVGASGISRRWRTWRCRSSAGARSSWPGVDGGADALAGLGLEPWCWSPRRGWR